MSEISRAALFGKLNALAYKAIESATVFCKMRGNPYVELEHWFAQLLQQQDSDLHRVIQHYGLDISVLARDMTAALDRLPRGATAISDFSPHIENAIERAFHIPDEDPFCGGGLPLRSAPSEDGSLEVDLAVPFKVAKQKLVDAFEKQYLQAMLRATRGNISEAARRAQIDRMHLYKLITQHHLHPAD